MKIRGNMKVRSVFFLLLLGMAKITAEEFLIPYELDNKVGFINERMEIVYCPQFDGIRICYEKQAKVYKKDSKKKLHNFIVNKETIIAQPNDADDCFIIGNDRYGFIYGSVQYQNCKDDIVTSVLYSNSSDEEKIFHNIQLLSSLSEDSISIIDMEHSPRYNYIDLKGNKLLKENKDIYIKFYDPNFDRGVTVKDYCHYIIDGSMNVVNRNDFYFYNRFSRNGTILGENKNEQGFFDINGNLLIPISRIPEMDINFVCNRLPVVINSQGKYDLYSNEFYHSNDWAILDNTGKIIKDHIEADEISSFSADGTAILKKFVENKTEYYLINTDGCLLCNEIFDKIQTSINGYSRAKKDGIDYLISSEDGTVYKCGDFF